MAKANRKTVVVGLDPKHKTQVREVIGRLEKKGFVLEQSLAEIGVLTGSAPADALDDLKSVEGVAHVEQNREDYKPQ